MPIYVYQVIKEDGSDGPCFEIQQSMQDAPLEKHPETGEPVRRVYLPPHIGTRYSDRQTSATLGQSNLEKHGFTRYEKDKSTGTYHRTAGKQGPDTLQP